MRGVVVDGNDNQKTIGKASGRHTNLARLEYISPTM